MLNNITCNPNLLHDIFTEKDFSFINGMDKEIETLQSEVKSQEEKREHIISFINNLNNAIALPENKNSDLFSKSLTNANAILDEINKIINEFHTLKDNLEQIIENIISLLVSIESSKEDKSFYNAQVLDIKSSIYDYSCSVANVKNKVFVNNIKIDQLFHNVVLPNFSFEFSTATKEPESKSDSIKSDTNTPVNSQTTTLEDNNTLIISEKTKKVFLPYTVREISAYLEQYPEQYSSYEDVIEKEFILPIENYVKHFVVSRFRETYALIRDRETKSVVEALKYAIDLMFRSELSPAIIAGCKTQAQLENYLYCLEHNQLEEFKDFKIVFEINPL